MHYHAEQVGNTGRGTMVVKPQAIPPKAANIAECTVTTDSVVATATVRVPGTMRRIVAQWGDGSVDTLHSTPGVPVVVGSQPQLPPGTYQLAHAYQAPEDRNAFSHIVLIQVTDVSGGVDYCISPITLTPRYRVTNYRTRLSPGNGCDSAPESRSEFEATMHVDADITAFWQWVALEPGITGLVGDDWYVLEGSVISRELTIADGPVSVFLNVVEKDPVFDDVLPSIGQDLRASYESGPVQGSVSGGGVIGSPCTVHYRYDRQVTLLVPLPPAGQTITIKT
jgi:hypothetical protein